MDLVLRVGGWFAVLSGVATLLTFVTGILFFTVGGPYGVINDISSVVHLLFMVPLVYVLYRLLPADARLLGLLAALLGISGIIASGYGQTLLVLRRIDFAESMRYFPAGAGIGLWLMMTCALALFAGVFPPGLAWFGIAAGAGYILTVWGFLLGGQQNPLFYIGGLLLGLGYPVWGVWLGRLLLTGALPLALRTLRQAPA